MEEKRPDSEIDASDAAAVADLAARTRVAVTTVGPYLKYGTPLAAANCRAGRKLVAAARGIGGPWK